MATEISPLSVRRGVLIKATPERIWQEFETFERMRSWYGTGHTLTKFEPRVGGEVETHAGDLVFVGRVVAFDPPRELTFEQDWVGRGWKAPALITIRLSPMSGGTLVELFHHGFERTGEDPAQQQRGFEGGWTARQLEALAQLVEA